MIKKLIEIVIAASVLVLIAAAVSVATGVFALVEYDLGSQKFADAAMVSICSRWDESALINRASADLVSQLRSDRSDGSVFGGFNALGRMREFGGAVGSARIVRGGSGDPIVIASYSSQDRFENGEAKVMLTMVRSSGGWKILRFSVRPVFATASGATNADSHLALAPQY